MNRVRTLAGARAPVSEPSVVHTAVQEHLATCRRTGLIRRLNATPANGVFIDKIGQSRLPSARRERAVLGAFSSRRAVADDVPTDAWSIRRWAPAGDHPSNSDLRPWPSSPERRPATASDSSNGWAACSRTYRRLFGGAPKFPPFSRSFQPWCRLDVWRPGASGIPGARPVSNRVWRGRTNSQPHMASASGDIQWRKPSSRFHADLPAVGRPVGTTDPAQQGLSRLHDRPMSRSADQARTDRKPGGAAAPPDGAGCRRGKPDGWWQAPCMTDLYPRAAKPA